MNLKLQKQLAGKVLNISPKRVRIDNARHEEIKEAITREDVRALIKDGAIRKVQSSGISQGRTRKLRQQKRKGLRKGHGSRKGTFKARSGGKAVWVKKIRVLREFLYEIRDKEIISKITFKDLIKKAKGGFFRNKRHVKVFIEERQLVQKGDKQ